MKLITIIGARPQIIKAAAISRAIQSKFEGQIEEVIVHTGQHYDENMSAVFFEELGIPQPHYNLSVGSGAHGEQTAKMLTGIEEIIDKENPSAIILYGDTNSTLAGAVAAVKVHLPVVHIEAGLRSYNKAMPEEINRIMCDHASTLLFSPTKAGLVNLEKEGFAIDNEGPYSVDNPKVYHCGDIMYDNSLHFASMSEGKTDISKFGADVPFVLVTCHRPSNTDDVDNLSSVFEALIHVSKDQRVVLPIHPRTKVKYEALPEELKQRVSEADISITEPASFLEMVALEKNAEMVITDSGGVQKEAFFFEKPCIIMREQTEWIEIVECGSAILTGPDKDKICEAYATLRQADLQYPSIFGDGKAAEFICGEIYRNL